MTPNGYGPVLLRAADTSGAKQIKALLASGQVRDCRDELRAQLEELVETREPSLRRSPELRAKRVEELLHGSPPARYGVWVFYPWLGTLVHLLPEAAFIELRTSRNRDKISADDQEALRKKTIGIVGFSVGNASAVAMALDGIGGYFRLAEFDRLSLSSLNRTAGSCTEIGLNKAIVAARRMFEIDPFLEIDIYPGRLAADALGTFMSGLDLVIAECDDLELKLAVRRQARELRLPVLAERSSREAARRILLGSTEAPCSESSPLIGVPPIDAGAARSGPAARR